MAEKHAHDIEADTRFVEPCGVEMAEVMESKLCSVYGKSEPAYGAVKTLLNSFNSGSGFGIDEDISRFLVNNTPSDHVYRRRADRE